MAESSHDRELLGRIVLHDEKLAHLGARKALDALERRLEAVGGEGFVDVGERAALETVLPLLFHREDLHRNVTRLRIALELVQDRPAEHVGQEHIERHGSRLVLTREREGIGAVLGDDALEAAVAREVEQHTRVMRIVLDDEQHQIARLQSLAIVGHLLRPRRRQHDRLIGSAPTSRRPGLRLAVCRTRVRERQIQREGTAAARDAAQADLPAEQMRQLAADGKSESRAAVLAGGTGIGLLERFEDDALLLRRDADAGVTD